MLVSHFLLTTLEAALAETSDVLINAGVDARTQLDNVEADVRAHICMPFSLTAVVMPPGFPDIAVGASISGQCIAHSCAGYWLVYRHEQDQFYCFWGADPENLGAHGVFGSPIYCWSA